MTVSPWIFWPLVAFAIVGVVALLAAIPPVWHAVQALLYRLNG